MSENHFNYSCLIDLNVQADRNYLTFGVQNQDFQLHILQLMIYFT
jgi:hypothetical protein